MARRASLPGADELFGGRKAAAASGATGVDTDTAPDEQSHDPAPARSQREGKPAASVAGVATPDTSTPDTSTPDTSTPDTSADSDPARGGPTGRVRHDEKITVYVSTDELLDLEGTRLSLRREHGLAVDRGRLVREAIHLALEDAAVNGAESALVRRLNAS